MQSELHSFLTMPCWNITSRLLKYPVLVALSVRVRLRKLMPCDSGAVSIPRWSLLQKQRANSFTFSNQSFDLMPSLQLAMAHVQRRVVVSLLVCSGFMHMCKS